MGQKVKKPRSPTMIICVMGNKKGASVVKVLKILQFLWFIPKNAKIFQLVDPPVVPRNGSQTIVQDIIAASSD
jgi:hypothetical protein